MQIIHNIRVILHSVGIAIMPLNDVFISAVGVFILLLLYIVFRNRLDYKENCIVSAIMVSNIFFPSFGGKIPLLSTQKYW